MAADSVIDIDSGESDREVPEACAQADAQAAAAAAALAQEPVQEKLVCRLLLPSQNGRTEPHAIGDGAVALDGPAEELVLWALPAGEAAQVAARVPVAWVTAVHVRNEGRLLVLSVYPPLLAEGLLAEHLAALRGEEEAEASGDDETADSEAEDPDAALQVTMLALLFASAWVRPALAALQAWLPQLPIYGPRSLGLREFVPLRFQSVVLAETDNALLAEGQWLNDTAMDFFLRLAVELAGPAELRGEVYLASTQFFSRLASCGAHSGEKGWENVRTWTRSVAGGVVAKRYLVYPVNEENLHWWVALVCRASDAMEEAPASGQGPQDDGPRIVCLDSACEPPPKGRHMDMLKGYLRRELFTQLGGRGQGSDFSDPVELVKQVARWKALVIASERMRVCLPEAPQQENAFDCGVFVIEFLLHLLREPERFKSLGLGSHMEWFDQVIVTHRRGRMRDIVAILQRLAPRGAKELDVSALLQEDQQLRASVAAALLDLPEEASSPEYDSEEPPPSEGAAADSAGAAATAPATGASEPGGPAEVGARQAEAPAGEAAAATAPPTGASEPGCPAEVGARQAEAAAGKAAAAASGEALAAAAGEAPAAATGEGPAAAAGEDPVKATSEEPPAAAPWKRARVQ